MTVQKALTFLAGWGPGLGRRDGAGLLPLQPGRVRGEGRREGGQRWAKKEAEREREPGKMGGALDCLGLLEYSAVETSCPEAPKETSSLCEASTERVAASITEDALPRTLAMVRSSKASDFGCERQDQLQAFHVPDSHVAGHPSEPSNAWKCQTALCSGGTLRLARRREDVDAMRWGR